MEELKEQVDTILKQIPNEQFQNMIAYVAKHDCICCETLP